MFYRVIFYRTQCSTVFGEVFANLSSVRLRTWLVGPIATAMVACCGGSEPSAATPPGGGGSGAVAVRIVYLASTVLRTDFSLSELACVRDESPTHMHVSWLNYQPFNMVPVGSDRWEATFDVPPDVRHLVLITDPNLCDRDQTASVTQNVFANDVPLTDVQSVSGTDPPASGLGFTVASDGRVSP